MRKQSLSYVCNGCHLYDLPYPITPDKVLKAMGRETKAIAIIGIDCDKLKGFRSWGIKVSTRNHRVRAKKLYKWSNYANLWMFRTD